MRIFILVLIFSTQVQAKKWNKANSPYKFEKNLELNFDILPLKASIVGNQKLWPGYYWAYNKGGVGYRWIQHSSAYKNKRLSLEQLKKMSPQEISQLSPIEKLDILNNDYKYTKTKRAKKYSNSSSSDWNGICHGVAAASLNHDEPQIKSFTNEEGIKIDFFVSDIKALLGFYYAENKSKEVKQIGKRCFFNRSTPILGSRSACKDVNAGSFHLVLTNLIGIQNRSFLADLDEQKQVWNHPIQGFESLVLKDEGRRIQIKTKIFYPKTIEPQYGPVIGTSLDYIENKTYSYWLELDDQRNIVGGKWSSKEHPDFLWIQKILELPDIYQVLL